MAVESTRKAGFDIGRANHKITFRSYGSVDDGYGGKIDTPVDVLTTWAIKEPLKSSRNLEQNQLVMKNAVRYKVRWRKEFEPTKSMRIVDSGNELAINSIVEVKAEKRHWEITAIERE